MFISKKNDMKWVLTHNFMGYSAFSCCLWWFQVVLLCSLSSFLVLLQCFPSLHWHLEAENKLANSPCEKSLRPRYPGPKKSQSQENPMFFGFTKKQKKILTKKNNKTTAYETSITKKSNLLLLKSSPLAKAPTWNGGTQQSARVLLPPSRKRSRKDESCFSFLLLLFMFLFHFFWWFKHVHLFFSVLIDPFVVAAVFF